MSLKLFVGNLSFTTGEAELREAFGVHGTITDVHIASDRFSGRPRGFGFVTFGTDSEARAAIEKMNGAVIGGNAIAVNEARAKEEGSTTVGGRTYTSPNRKAGAFHARGKRRY